MKLLIMKFSPLPGHFDPRRSYKGKFQTNLKHARISAVRTSVKRVISKVLKANQWVPSAVDE
jgi:hypothetical protein